MQDYLRTVTQQNKRFRQEYDEVLQKQENTNEVRARDPLCNHA
jgi:hypothetical protein